ncbi:unnamed protein product [Bemisia tabaci]|uniref:BZIP domain-containing protein n=1 Tax=Bemisia tabaci TaxID=7038 RepID=A0A9P0AJQ1_BEMTA|nr:PREDICTED: protein CREBRF homolog [Bemisia tabaci]CAH0391984.1 unnamed protein product [Bemisia tabaci]
MTDPLYSGFDTNFPLKSEPSQDTIMGSQNPSASVPIPARRMNELTDFSGLDQYSVSPYSNLVPDPTNVLESSLFPGNNSQLWDPVITNSNFLDVKMDDDDIFQDTTNPLQDLTLAELNGLNNSTSDPLEGLNFDDMILPDATNCFNNYIEPVNKQQSSPLDTQALAAVSISNTNVASSFPPDSTILYRDSHIASTSMPSSPLNPVIIGTSDKQYQTALSPVSHSSSSSLLTPPLQKPSTLHDLLLKKNSSLSPEAQHPLGQSVPGSGSHLSQYTSIGIPAPRYGSSNFSRLSSSAPTHMDALRHEQIWARRESRNHLLSTSSLAEGGSTSSLSTGGILSPDPTEFSFDDSDDDSDDHDEDYSSDGDSGSDNEGGTPGQKKKEKAFWQYNVQSKGPKGQRLVLNTKPEDPHFLNEITDPVFSPQCAVQGIKHSGKARKGDGNDLTPNPAKLHVIGKELDKLTHIIHDIAPVNELPYNARSKTRREKNKLASRACRLKKKAQHEANKIKLVGLETEHKRLIAGISQMKQTLYSAFAQESNGGQVDHQELLKMADKIVKQATKVKIAGQTTDFVNKVLDREKSNRSTALDDL